MQRRLFVLVLEVCSVAGGQVGTGKNAALPVPPTIEIDMTASLPISMRSAVDVQRNHVPHSAFVSVSDLAVPERARRELQKANQSLAKQNWAQARDRLTKAISFYPSYADAYNNLAVAYAYLGDVRQEREALEKAIALDDHLAVAHFNIGRVDIAQGKLSEAESALKKTEILAPLDPRAFIVLGYCQLLQKRFDDAIASSQEAHKLTAPHAIAHYVAARAFEQKNQLDRAAIELKLFFQEAPTGPGAEDARKELQIVQAALHE